jgi:CheY-like chemotaxis protein
MLLFLLFSFNAFLWDNDGGEFFYDSLGNPVGTEEYVKEALIDNGIAVVVDTLLPTADELLTYNMLWINCAWRDDEMIKQQERDRISDYISHGKKVYLEGNRVAGILEPLDPNFIHKFGVTYLTTNPTIPHEILGEVGTFLQGELFSYDTSAMLDEMIDRIDTTGNNAEIIYGTPIGKFLGARGIAGSDFQRDDDSTYATVFGSVSLSGLMSSPNDSIFTDRERRMEFVQKILGFFGFGKILVVDDNQSGIDRIQEDLDTLGPYYDVDSFPPDSAMVKSYNVLFWNTGGAITNTITFKDQCLIDYYLQWGGRVMLAGEGIGSEIGIPGQGEECWFLSKLFGTDYISDSITADTVIGMDVFSGIISLLSSHGADRLDTILGGVRIFRYWPSIAGIIYGGMKKENFNWKTEFLGFAYEGMKDRNNRLEFLKRTLQNFDFTIIKDTVSGVDEKRRDNPRTTPYPNPFTSYTIIPTRSNVFTVYSITGRFIKRIEGNRWYGRDKEGNLLPSGIYLFRSQSGEKGKVILLR